MTDHERILAEEYGITEEQIKSALQKQSKKQMKREVFDGWRRESERDRRRNNQFRNIKSLKKK